MTLLTFVRHDEVQDPSMAPWVDAHIFQKAVYVCASACIRVRKSKKEREQHNAHELGCKKRKQRREKRNTHK